MVEFLFVCPVVTNAPLSIKCLVNIFEYFHLYNQYILILSIYGDKLYHPLLNMIKAKNIFLDMLFFLLSKELCKKKAIVF